MNPYSFGADKSKDDIRTVTYQSAMSGFYTEGGIDYAPCEIEHQHYVGICTGICLTQERQKANGKKYSADFQYLLQKKFIDLNWYEGSSLLSALKVGFKYGFLPIEHWIYTIENDRLLPYDKYIAKLQAIPEYEITRLLSLCTDKIVGYAQINVNDPTAIAKAILGSKAGIYCRYEVGSEWFTAPIDPLRPPKQVISGHAITMSRFNYNTSIKQLLVNTWGTLWNLGGKANINYENYRMTEAWVVSEKAFFVNDLSLGMTHPDVKRLQKFLNDNGFPVALLGAGSPGHETEYFGDKTQKAVIAFQLASQIKPAIGYCGVITRTLINSLI